MILVTGATGFVGSHLVRALAAAGHRVRALARDEKSASRIRGENVEAAVGNVLDRASMDRAAQGCDAVIHLVGIIQQGPGFTFESIHVDGTRNTIEAAKKAGTVKHFIYQSALGTRKDGPTEYYRTKYAAEILTASSGLDYTITRPSIIFGDGDGFTAKLIGIIKPFPVVPVVGSGRSKLQPIYIGDLAQVFTKVIYNPEFFGKTLELGGPEQLTFDRIVDRLQEALGTKKPKLHIPECLVSPAAAVMEKILPNPPVTTDQLRMLREDNVCDTRSLERFDIKPTTFAEGLRTFIR